MTKAKNEKQIVTSDLGHPSVFEKTMPTASHKGLQVYSSTPNVKQRPREY